MADEINRQTELVSYTVSLTSVDKIELADKLGKLGAEKDRLTRELSRITSDLKAGIKDVDLETDQIITALRDGEVSKSGECYLKFDWESGVVDYRLEETDELVHTRPVTPEEKQLNLFSKEQAGGE